MFKVKDFIGDIYTENYLSHQDYVILNKDSKVYKDLQSLSEEDLGNFDITDLNNSVCMVKLTEDGWQLLSDYIDDFIEDNKDTSELTKEEIDNLALANYYEVIDNFKKFKGTLEPNIKKMMLFNSSEFGYSRLIPNTDIFCPSFNIDIYSIADEDELFEDLVVCDNDGTKYLFFDFLSNYKEDPSKFSKEVIVTDIGIVLKVSIDK